MKKIYLYVRSSCNSSVETKDGYAIAMLRYKDNQKLIFYNEQHTTTNRIALKMILKAIESLKETCDIEIYTSGELGFSRGYKGTNKDLVIAISDKILQKGHIYKVVASNIRQNELNELLRYKYNLKDKHAYYNKYIKNNNL